MKTLELRFINEEGRTIMLGVPSPVEPIDPVLVSQVMDEIIEANVFTSTGGNYIGKMSARVVERTVEEVELV